MNHSNRSLDGKQGKELAEKIMSALAGRVGLRIGGQRIMWDSLKKKSELCISNYSIPNNSRLEDGSSIPVKHLIKNLTNEEIEELENLPNWNGNNEYVINMTCLKNLSRAIMRYKGIEFDDGRWE
ncbi:MAG TPA: hypothetical protein PLR90_05620 [Methylophilus sp.]|nr:hypothetical protein [Methylophilus sp.]HQQ33375.1 hypothetical protein [Methylophilus sp.]